MAQGVDALMAVQAVPWGYLVARLMQEPERSGMTMEQYKGLTPDQQSVEKRKHGYAVPCSFKPVGPPNEDGRYRSYRSKSNLVSIFALKIDVEVDKAAEARLALDSTAPTHAPSMQAVQGVVAGFEAVIHESRSSTPEALRGRVWVPLAGGWTPPDAYRAAHYLCDQFEQAGIAVDRTSSTDLVRPAFLPTLNSDQPWNPVHQEGRAFRLADIPRGYMPTEGYKLPKAVDVPTWEAVDLASLNLSVSVQKMIAEERSDGEQRHQQVFAVCCGMLRAGCDDTTILRVVSDSANGVSNKPLEDRSPEEGMRWASGVLAAAHEAVDAGRDVGRMFEPAEGTVQTGPPSLLDWLQGTLLPSYLKHLETVLTSLEAELPEDRPEGFRERMRRLTTAFAQRGDLGFAIECRQDKVPNEPDKSDLRKEAERLAGLVSSAVQAERTVGELTAVVEALEAGGGVADVPTHLIARYQESFFPAAPIPPETIETKRAALAEACSGILASRNVLELVVDAVHRLGVAGEERAIRALYLMGTSRLFESAVQVKVYGESSSGKSFTSDGVLLKLLPEGAVIEISNMSPKALIDMDDLRHKILYLVEGSMLQVKDTADEKALMIRELISRGYLVHHRDVKDPITGTFHTETIRRDGPISFVTTSTGRLHAEVETRLITVFTDSSAYQNRVVLRSMAERQGVVVPLPEDEMAAWHAYQEWLSLGPKKVQMPFLGIVAELMSAAHPRVRRDFGQLILLIRAHAVLQQRHRETDGEGRIVATLDDYEIARGILVDMMARAEGAAVSHGVRQLVGWIHQEAVQLWRVQPHLASEDREPTFEELKAIQVPISTSALALQLKISQSSASESAKDAVTGGYLLNHESRPKQRMRLSLDVPLPGSDDFDHVLPSRDMVAQHMDTDIPSWL